MDKIAIWGTGELAKKVYYLCKDRFEIVTFYDNDEKRYNTTLFGIPIKKWTPLYKYKIIIASMYWREISEQLMESGLFKGKDFAVYSKYVPMPQLSYSEIFYLTDMELRGDAKKSLLPDKKIAVVYGNCQTVLIEKAMRLHSLFSKDYIVITIPKVCDYINNKELLEYFTQDRIFWEQVDLFIYQTVSVNNRFSETLNTNEILQKLRPDCKTINIVNVYFDGYYPQLIKNERMVLRELHQSGLFPFGDKYIDDMLDKNVGIHEVISRISKDDFISETEVMSQVEQSFCNLENREDGVDIKISDYIKQHYREEQLFYSPNHPCERLMKIYIDRILEFLGYIPEEISEADRSLNVGTLKGQDIPIYPAVIKILGLKKYEKRYYPNRYLIENLALDFKEFAMKYIASIP